MAVRRVLGADGFPLSHLPTVMLVVGYPVFWLEMSFLHRGDGRTSPLAWTLFLGATAVVLVFRKGWGGAGRGLAAVRRAPARRWFVIGGLLAAGILGIAGRAAFLPPHLPQEFDALQYHLTIPRQHLITGSFTRIPWAAEDLFPLPVDFALAPYWFATALPNKVPQFLFLLGLLAVGARSAVREAGGRRLTGVVFVLAVIGSHGFGIQMGTAMLDLVLAYLFAAAWDSWRTGRWVLCAVEAGFFVWAKSFLPLQAVASTAILAAALGAGRRMGMRPVWGFRVVGGLRTIPRRRFAALLLVVSLVVAGPFVAKSLYYAGTPLYPFAPGLVPSSGIDRGSEAWRSLEEASRVWMTRVRNGYGHGRSPTAFLRHFWLLAVPESGVNNAFDYPLGLPYLLTIGPFFVLGLRTLRRRRLPVLPLTASVLWTEWWFGCQQSRFLFVPLLIVMVTTIPWLERSSRGLAPALAAALCFNFVSVLRAHGPDLGASAHEVLRPKDREILRLDDRHASGKLRGPVTLSDHDAAFARFPVVVRKEALPHTLAF